MKTILLQLIFILLLVQAALAQNNFIEVEGKASRKIKPETLTYALEIPLYDDYSYEYDYSSDTTYVVEEEESVEEELVEEDTKSKKKKKKDKDTEENNDYQPYKEPDYKDDYNYNDYTYEEVDPKEKKAEILDKLSQNLGIDLASIKENKGFMGEALFNLSSDKLSLLITIPGSRQKEIEQILDTLSQPNMSSWRLFKSEVSPATRSRIEKELLIEAIQDARTKAQFIAKSENRPLGVLMSVSENPQAGTDILSQIYGEQFKSIFQGLFGGMLNEGEVEIVSNIRVKFAF